MVAVPTERSDNEVDPMLHEPADEMYIAGQAVEARDD